MAQICFLPSIQQIHRIFRSYQILILFLNNSEVFHKAFLQKHGWNLLFWKISHEIQAEFICNTTWLLSFPLILANKIFIEYVPTHSEHNWNVKDFPYCKFRTPSQTTLLGCPKYQVFRASRLPRCKGTTYSRINLNLVFSKVNIRY